MPDSVQTSMHKSMLSLRETLLRYASSAGTTDDVVEVDGEKLLISKVKSADCLLKAFQNEAGYSLLIQHFSPAITHHSNSSEASNAFRTSSTPRHNGTAKLSADMDVTGSPLKCSFTAYDEEESVLSLTVQEVKPSVNKTQKFSSLRALYARSCVSKLLRTLKNDGQVQLPLPVWFVCDAADAMKTALLGFFKDEKGYHKGTMTISDSLEDRDLLPSMNALMVQFLATSPIKRVSTSAKATYEVLSALPDSNSQIDITCIWERPLMVFSSPSVDAVSSVRVHVDPDDLHHGPTHLIQDIQRIQDIMESLTQREIMWYSRETGPSVEEMLDDMFESMTAKESAEKNREEDFATLTFEDIIEEKMITTKHYLDFTDLLWSVLIKCESLQELKGGLQKVFLAVCNGVIRPQIPSKRSSQVAQICRGLMRGQIPVPVLSDVQPLEMVIEIGLEKVKRNFLSIFQVGELATSEQLSCFVNWDVSSKTFSDCLQKLKQLSVVVRLVILLRHYLNLNSSHLSYFVAEALRIVKEPGFASDFSFLIHTSLILDLLKSLQPSVWEVKLCTDDHQEIIYQKHSVLTISQQPQILLTGGGEAGSEGNKENPSYYCSLMTVLSDPVMS